MSAEIGRVLNAMPDVFSTPQWGGRAYKLPGRGGRTKKPVLLAHVCPEPNLKAASVSFKLPKPDAKKSVRDHEWITPHSFRTLAPSGWVTAIVKTKSQLRTLRQLLLVSRSMHPRYETLAEGLQEGPPETATASRVESTLRQLADTGWRPRDED
jgi:hypothetical protein